MKQEPNGNLPNAALRRFLENGNFERQQDLIGNLKHNLSHAFARIMILQRDFVYNKIAQGVCTQSERCPTHESLLPPLLVTSTHLVEPRPLLARHRFSGQHI